MARRGRPLVAGLVLLAFVTGWLAGRAPGLWAEWQVRRAQIAAAVAPAAKPPAALASLPAVPLPAPLPPPRRLVRAAAAPPPRLLPAPATIFVPMPVLVPAPQPAALAVAPAAAAPPPAPIATAAAATAFDQATAAYAALAQGQRAAAHRLFQAALAQAPDNAGWRAADRALTAHWQGQAWALGRAAGPVGPTAGPVLGGGQLGGSLAWVPQPLARRPLALVARAFAATRDDGGIDATSAQAALGLRWQLLPQLSVTAERLQPLAGGAGDWNLRLAGGADGQDWHVYGEAGALARGTAYAGGSARWLPLALPGHLHAGAGLWAGAQGPLRSAGWAGRLDAGPALAARLGPVQLEAGWRFRVAGNAAPGSGPALLVSAGF